MRRISASHHGPRSTFSRTASCSGIVLEGSIYRSEIVRTDSLRRILVYLHGQGHWKAAVTYRRDATPGALAVTFTVKAGEVFRAAQVRVDGAQAVNSAAIATIVKLMPGNVFVEATLDLRRSVAAVEVPVVFMLGHYDRQLDAHLAATYGMAATVLDSPVHHGTPLVIFG